MDITERIEEIQDNPRPFPFSLENLSSATFSVNTPDGQVPINMEPVEFGRFIEADVNSHSHGVITASTIDDSGSFSDLFQATGRISLDASVIRPAMLARYVQLTEEDYDTMLERISSLEERLAILERRL